MGYAISKPELKQRLVKRLSRWGVPPHKYQIKFERGKVILRLLNPTGEDVFEIPTTAGPSTLETRMQAIEFAIRKSELRRQTDLEDFTGAAE